MWIAELHDKALKALLLVAQCMAPWVQQQMPAPLGSTTLFGFYSFPWVSSSAANEPVCQPLHPDTIASTPNISLHKDKLYANVRLGCSQEAAHRLVCWAVWGPPPAPNPPQGQEPVGQHAYRDSVGHMCDNPWCLQPLHLKWTNAWYNLPEHHHLFLQLPR